MADPRQMTAPEAEDPSKDRGARQYEPPRVELLGNLAELTHGIPGPGGDGGFPGGHVGS